MARVVAIRIDDRGGNDSGQTFRVERDNRYGNTNGHARPLYSDVGEQITYRVGSRKSSENRPWGLQHLPKFLWK